MRRILGAALLAGAGLLIRSPSHEAVEPRLPEPPPPEIGVASYYAADFDSLPTASGERFDVRRLTAAHRSLPFGTRVLVTNLRNHRSVVVRINDRGPFVKGRVIDVSLAAARKLAMTRHGAAPVRLDVLRSHRSLGG